MKYQCNILRDQQPVYIHPSKKYLNKNLWSLKMDNIGYGHQIAKITVFFPTDNEKYSLHDLHLRYK